MRNIPTYEFHIQLANVYRTIGEIMMNKHQYLQDNRWIYVGYEFRADKHVYAKWLSPEMEYKEFRMNLEEINAVLPVYEKI